MENQNPSEYSPAMASASLALGLFSVILIATGFSVITGSLGLILALLSRGAGPLSQKAKTGLFTSLVGILGGIVITGMALFAIFSGDWRETLNRLETLYETYITTGTLDPSDVDRVLNDDSSLEIQSDKTALRISFFTEEETDA
ncbi:MAG: hypothetical protein Q4B85_11320 [Lachnospiraceae bacterium]|nr:hypothetical protein [Lachnospiraceae bacterium]